MATKSLNTNPWLKIWTQPRETIKAIVKFDPKYRFLILSWIYGFPMILHSAQNASLAMSLPTGAILVIAAALAIFVGMLAFTIMSGFLLWTGKWIGGKGSFLQIRAAISWANVPNVVNIVLWGILIGAFRSNVFLNTFAQTPFMGQDLAIVTPIFL